MRTNYQIPFIQSQSPTVITPTPPGSPKPQRASIPLTPTLPNPPRHSSCITFGQINLDNPPNSPTCSEVSPIGGEVFQDEIRPDLIPTGDRISNSNQSSIMEQAEDLVEDTRVKLESRMRMYTALHLENSNVFDLVLHYLHRCY